MESASKPRLFLTEAARIDLTGKNPATLDMAREELGAEVYSRLLDRIERSNYDVFRRRVRLPLWEKSWIVWRALVG